MPKVHVIGGGLAGLAAGLYATQLGFKVNIYEAAGQLGGRCRSFYDEAMGCHLDNGNHLMLSGNVALNEYLALSGAGDCVRQIDEAIFPFFNVKTGRSWCLNIGDSLFPWWIFNGKRRLPDTRVRDYYSIIRVLMANEDQFIKDIVPEHHPLAQVFWIPLTLAVLNTPYEDASAGMLARVLRETFLKGKTHAKAIFPRGGLSDALVKPVVKVIERNGGTILTGYRLKDIDLSKERAEALIFNQGRFELRDGEDAVIVALPHHIVPSMLPDIDVPNGCNTILNIHYRISELPRRKLEAPFIGVIDGTAHWIFRKGDILSVTVSAAEDELVHEKAAKIADIVWPDVKKIMDLSNDAPVASKVIKEKRATFHQSPYNAKKRPSTKTPWRNVFLAGDWTDTGFPATIEGAIRSGFKAAKQLSNWKYAIPSAEGKSNLIPIPRSVPVSPQGTMMQRTKQ